MIKLVAFDWNGTLISDTVPAWKAANKTRKYYREKPISLLKFRKTFTVPIINMYLALGFKKKIDFHEQSLIYHDYLHKFSKKIKSRAGSRETLQWLKNKHIKRMIYSNHLIPKINEVLIRLDFHKYFDDILGRPAGDHSHMYIRSKDQKLYDYIQSYNFKPKEVLTVGDTEEEIEIGKKFGFYTVGITGGFNTEARLKKHKPNYLIHNLKDLINIIKKLNEHS